MTPQAVARGIRLRPFGLAAAFALAAGAVSAADVVIFRDGFKIQGRRFKEQEVLGDSSNGLLVQIPAVKGFDIIEDGPKWIVFSSNTKQLGAAVETAKAGPPVKEYERQVYVKTKLPMPAFGEFKAADFDAKWQRKIKVNTGGGEYEIIEQTILKLGPKRIIIASPTHSWTLVYGTKEMPIRNVRAMLATHPDLAETDGKPDVDKRLSIAAFLKEVGWLAAAKDEIDKLKVAVPAAWTKEQTERADALLADIPKAETTAAVDELELAVSSGRYAAARKFITAFDPKFADAADTKRFTDLQAQVQIIEPRFEKLKRLFRNALDDLAGAAGTTPHAAAGGAVVVPVAAAPPDARTATLVDAGEAVFAELHPDTVSRIETFGNLASQAEAQKKAGKPTTSTPASLVALAVSGWMLGKNGADPDVAAAARNWRYRQMLLDYQAEPLINNRRAIAKAGLAGGKPPYDVLAQIVTLLPPPQPENLTTPAAKPVPPSDRVLPGLVRKNTGPLREVAAGVDYVLRLPPEYHHGRPYPVVIAVPHANLPPEQMASLLAADADRNGYIVASPMWVTDKPYDYKGDQHYKVLAVLRDLLKRYRVENDRVFVFGYGDGANFALDVAASHPDRFAGVVAMAPGPKYQGVFSHYWRNTQKLPVYIVNGNLNGNGYDNLRRIFEHWMPKGFPAVMNIYRGRGMEWYGLEIPTIFDWMGRKKRVTGTASLRLNVFGGEPWQVMRPADDRFYWVGTTSVAKGNLRENNETRSFLPAEVAADIRQGNLIEVRCRGLKNVVLWLDRDMINWTKPVFVRINGASPTGYKAKIIEPDIDVMLESLYAHGDRSMLFLNKLEFDTNP